MSKKVIIVTGASSGLGKSAAEYLAKQGHKVYGTSRKPSNTFVANYTLLPLDVTKEDSTLQLIQQVLERENRLDVLINNAGVGLAGPIETTTVEEAKWQFEVNFFGLVRMCQAVLPVMRQQQSGKIINLSSIGGLMGLPYQGFYSASKFAVEGLSESLRLELRGTGVHVVLLEPGDFKTDFTDNRQLSRHAKTEKQYTQQFEKTLATLEYDEANGADPILVAWKIKRIINSRTPKARYMVGPFEQQLFAKIKAFLPTSLFEMILANHYKINAQ